MKDLARCGLDCETCEARIATISNDDALRETTARKWAEMNNAPEITAATINCLGCRTDGVKFGYCARARTRTRNEEKSLHINELDYEKIVVRFWEPLIVLAIQIAFFVVSIWLFEYNIGQALAYGGGDFYHNILASIFHPAL